MPTCEKCKVTITQHLVEELGVNMCRKCEVINRASSKDKKSGKVDAKAKSPNEKSTAPKANWIKSVAGGIFKARAAR